MNLIQTQINDEIIAINPDTGLSQHAHYSADFLQIEYTEPPTVHEWAWDFQRSIVDLWDVRMWRLGYMLLQGERLFGEDYACVLDMDIWHDVTPRKAKYVCSRFLNGPLFGLSFSHHEAVAKFEEHERIMWLERAASERWARDELRRQLKLTYQPDTIIEPPADTGGSDLTLPDMPKTPHELADMVTLATLRLLQHKAEEGPWLVRNGGDEPIGVFIPWGIYQLLGLDALELRT